MPIYSEAEKFNQQATSWWDKNGNNKILHRVNPVRLSYIKQHTHLAGRAILDVGCGGGILTEALSQELAYLTGVDAAANLIAVAQEHAAAANLNISYQCAPAETIATLFPPQSFDIITCLELLEHVDEPCQLIAACSTLLKPQGILFISTLNQTPLAYLGAIIGLEYVLRQLPIGTHSYRKFITPHTLYAYCKDSGLTLQNFTGIGYNPFTEYAYLNKNLNINYIGYATKDT